MPNPLWAQEIPPDVLRREDALRSQSRAAVSVQPSVIRATDPWWQRVWRPESQPLWSKLLLGEAPPEILKPVRGPVGGFTFPGEQPKPPVYSPRSLKLEEETPLPVLGVKPTQLEELLPFAAAALTPLPGGAGKKAASPVLKMLAKNWKVLDMGEKVSLLNKAGYMGKTATTIAGQDWKAVSSVAKGKIGKVYQAAVETTAKADSNLAARATIKAAPVKQPVPPVGAREVVAFNPPEALPKVEPTQVPFLPPPKVPSVEIPTSVAAGKGAGPPKLPVAKAGEFGEAEFAGNIKLSKFPKEFHDELSKWAEDTGRLETQRRGVRSWAETRKAADTLAQVTGGNPEELAKKLGQAYNAEEIEAIRGLLLQSMTDYKDLRRLVDAGDTSVPNLLKVSQAKSRMDYLIALTTRSAAEAGRSLNIHRKIVQALQTQDVKVMRRVMRMVNGQDDIEKFMKATKNVDWDNPVEVYNIIRQLKKPKLLDYPYEIFVNSILSGPRTHMTNFLTTAINTAKEPFDTVAAGLLDIPLSVIQRRPRQYFAGEAVVELATASQGFKDGIRAALHTMKYGMKPDALEKLEFRPSAFGGTLGRVINLPVTAMEASDQLFYSINYRMALAKLSYRQLKQAGTQGNKLGSQLSRLIANPTEDMTVQAHKIAIDRLFRREAGKTTTAIMKGRDSFYPLKFLLPFVRTPVNLTKVGLEISPLGIFNPKLLRNLATRNPEAAEQLSKVLTGSMLAGALYLYAREGRITGAPPSNPAARDRFYREGKQPFSIKLGDKWVSYQRLEPFNHLFTQVAAASQGAIDVGEITLTIAKNLVSQTYMTTIAGIINALEDPERYAADVGTRIATGLLIPFSAATRTVAQAIDPVVRQPQTLAEKFAVGIPGLSQKVPPRLTAFGEPSIRQSPAFSSVNISTESVSAVDRELGRLGTEVGLVGDTIGGRKLTREGKWIYQRYAGQFTYQALEQLFASASYQSLPDDLKKRAIDTASSRARQMARDMLFPQSEPLAPQPQRIAVPAGAGGGFGLQGILNKHLR